MVNSESELLDAARPVFVRHEWQMSAARQGNFMRTGSEPLECLSIRYIDRNFDAFHENRYIFRMVEIVGFKYGLGTIEIAESIRATRP